jgi:hypothetical protein
MTQPHPLDESARLERSRRRMLPSSALPTPWSDPDREELEILLAVAQASPRGFWERSKNVMFGHGENAYKLFAAAARDERLLRLALARMAAPRQEWARSFLGRGAANAKILIEGAYRHAQAEGKPQSWASSRAMRILPQFSTVPACYLFDVIGVCARHGDLSTVSAMVQTLPDARVDPNDRMLKSGRCGFASQDFGEASGRAAARKQLKSKKPPPAKPSRDRNDPTNAFFWIGARAGALRKKDPAQAALWGQAGAELAARLGPQSFNSGPGVWSALCCPETRQSAQNARPSFYVFERLKLVAEHLPLVPNEQLASVCLAEARIAGACRENEPPALGMALLQGRLIDPSWRDAWAQHDKAEFRIPLTVLAAAKEAQKIDPRWLSDPSSFPKGKKLTLNSLAKEMGQTLPWAPEPPSPRRASSTQTPSPPKRSPKA